MAYTARYTEQIVALVDAETRTTIDTIAETEDKSIGRVVRELIEVGLAAREPEAVS